MPLTFTPSQEKFPLNSCNTISQKAVCAIIGASSSTSEGRWATGRPVNAFNVKQVCAGYTLVETLVAVMLLSIAMTIVLQQFSGSMNAGRLSNDYSRAVWYAREKMDEIQLSYNISIGTIRGKLDDRYQWEAIVEPLALDLPAQPGGLVPVNIQVRIFWQHGMINKEIEFNTTALSGSIGKG